MLAAIPLTDDERAAVDDGHAALDSLLDRLADVPTPAGPTPRQIGIPPPPPTCRSSTSPTATSKITNSTECWSWPTTTPAAWCGSAKVADQTSLSRFLDPLGPARCATISAISMDMTRVYPGSSPHPPAPGDDLLRRVSPD